MENINQRKANILNEINHLGYFSQHNYLVSNGFANLKKNLKYLKRFEGDQEKALQYAINKKTSQDPSCTSTPEDESMEDDQSKETYPEFETGWPKNVEFLYLDGNNLLFVDSVIRNMAIKKKRRNEAERAFARLVLKFIELKNIKNTILVFDNTSYKDRCSLTNNNDETLMFQVESATPKFYSSDDALVYWASENRNLDACLFITSDKGLEQRLRKRGAKNIMKTKFFFKILRETLGNEQYDSLLKK